MRRRCAAPDSCRQDLMSTTTASGGDPAWVDDVLRFWFEELAEIDWFVRDDDVDARIRKRFLALHGNVVADGGVPVTSSPRALLAAVIVLDQFSRNLHRDDPRAFAADADARQLARSIVEQGFDRAMTNQERLFVYLPFEHSENPDDQCLSVRLVEELGNESWTRYALAHQVAINRFGRFPFRNAALGRSSTAAELAYMSEAARV
jgi:uncharacterized protein (DUF924 family)